MDLKYLSFHIFHVALSHGRITFTASTSLALGTKPNKKKTFDTTLYLSFIKWYFFRLLIAVAGIRFVAVCV